jgi:hypothetical protein
MCAGGDAMSTTVSEQQASYNEPIDVHLELRRDHLNWNPERAKFLKMLDSLMKTHPNKVVAIHEGQVVAVGDDKLKVADEAIRKFGNVPIYIGRVERQVEVCRIPSTRIVGRLSTWK